MLPFFRDLGRVLFFPALSDPARNFFKEAGERSLFPDVFFLCFLPQSSDSNSFPVLESPMRDKEIVHEV